MTEIRCPYCDKLLLKIEGGRESSIETVCPRCKRGLLLVIDRSGFGQMALAVGSPPVVDVVARTGRSGVE